MTEDPPAQRDEPIASLRAVLDEQSGGRRRLPRLLGRLDAAEQAVRIGAAWTICHVAAAHPDTVGYLTRRLADRVEAEDRSTEAELVFEYVAAEYPEAVDEELAAMESEAADRPRYWSIEGSLARANYHHPERGNRDVGRTRLAGEGQDPGGRQVYTDDGDEHDRLDRRKDDADAADGHRDDETDDGEDESDPPGDAGESDESGGAWQPADDLSSLDYGSRFDQLTVLAKRRRGRYADVYRTLGVIDGEELPVGLSLYHRPTDDRAGFAAALDERLGRWAGVSGHDSVVDVHDWGVEPVPWAATEYMGYRLGERDRLPLDDALWNAERLAEALTHLHENGVVHGGLDPGNVVYSGTAIDEDERQPPLLDNVGLLHVVREHFDPTKRLDPRYAAPEYFDRRFGRIDHATDVYHLGAVLYLLFTGRPPYEGEYGRIRRRVLSDPVPRPTDVVDVPAVVDDVVTKAMTRQKLRRYETVAHVRQDLRGVRNELEADDAR